MADAKAVSEFRVARAVIAALRCFALGPPASSRRRRDEALAALEGDLPPALAEECLDELAEIAGEIGAARPSAAIFALPDAPALAASEFKLIAVLSVLQRGDICRALEQLTALLADGRIGRTLFPMKSLALRLGRAGIPIRPIGLREFSVIACNTRPTPHAPARRPHLKVAR